MDPVLAPLLHPLGKRKIVDWQLLLHGVPQSLKPHVPARAIEALNQASPEAISVAWMQVIGSCDAMGDVDGPFRMLPCGPHSVTCNARTDRILTTHGGPYLTCDLALSTMISVSERGLAVKHVCGVAEWLLKQQPSSSQFMAGMPTEPQCFRISRFEQYGSPSAALASAPTARVAFWIHAPSKYSSCVLVKASSSCSSCRKREVEVLNMARLAGLLVF